MLDNILAIPQIADYLQISKSKLYLMVRRGDIAHITFGKNERIRESDLEAWIGRAAETG